MDERGLPDADAGNVGDGVPCAGRVIANEDAEVAESFAVHGLPP